MSDPTRPGATRPSTPRDPRRAPRPVAARPAPARPAVGLAVRPEPAAVRPASPVPTAAERIRLRRLVRGVLTGVVVAQSVALVLVLSPAARAQFAVIDMAVNTSVQLVNTSVQTMNQNVSRLFNTANGHLRDLARRAEQNDRPLSGSGTSAYVSSNDLRDVTETPIRQSQVGTGDTRAVTIADANGSAYLQGVVPGSVKWSNYTAERTRSADMTLLTLRGGVKSLNDFNRSIQDISRLREISNASRSATSDRALQQIAIESQLEVARQLQALRAQQALQTNLYAVTESHRVGTEARQHAQDNATNCDVLKGLLGPAAAIPGLCSGSGSLPSLP